MVTGSTAPEGKQPYEQATPESVIKSIMQREPDDLSAIEQIRQSQEWVGGTGHLLNLWSAAVRSAPDPGNGREDQSPAQRIGSFPVPA